MSESQTAEAVAPVRRMRRAVVLTTIMGGVFVATNDLFALRLGLLADVIGPTFSGEEEPAGVRAVHAGYTIAWMVSLLLWGKLSDVFGRRRLWLAGMILILAGSAGSATSQELIQLTISRLAQGLGVGAIFALGPALIGGLYPPAERAKRHGTIVAVLWLGLIGTPILLSLAFGQILLVSIPGAGIGQFLLARSSLFLSLLVGGLVLLATWIGLPAWRPGIRRRFDVAGALAFVGTMAPLLLMYQWSGGLFPWLSAPSVGLLVGAAAMLVVLVIVERRASEPLIDIRILKQRVFVVAAITMFAAGVGLMALNRYSPSFFPLPPDRSFEAGWDPVLLLALMALTPAMGAVVVGWIMARTGPPQGADSGAAGHCRGWERVAVAYGRICERDRRHAELGDHRTGSWRYVHRVACGGAKRVSSPQPGRSDCRHAFSWSTRTHFWRRVSRPTSGRVARREPTGRQYPASERPGVCPGSLAAIRGS